jgi:arylsulfatase A-like enzyme
MYRDGELVQKKWDNRLLTETFTEEVIRVIQEPSEKPFFWHGKGNATAIRIGQWKLHFNYGDEAPKDPPLTDGPALYNLDADPLEAHNLAAKHPEKVEQMLARAKGLLTDLYSNQVPLGTWPGVELDEPALKASDVWGR